MKKNSSISKRGVSVKEVKPMRRESQDVMAELVGQRAAWIDRLSLAGRKNVFSYKERN